VREISCAAVRRLASLNSRRVYISTSISTYIYLSFYMSIYLYRYSYVRSSLLRYYFIRYVKYLVPPSVVWRLWTLAANIYIFTYIYLRLLIYIYLSIFFSVLPRVKGSPFLHEILLTPLGARGVSRRLASYRVSKLSPRIYINIYWSIFIDLPLSIYLYIHLSIYLSMYLSIYIHLSKHVLG